MKKERKADRCSLERKEKNDWGMKERSKGKKSGGREGKIKYEMKPKEEKSRRDVA